MVSIVESLLHILYHWFLTLCWRIGILASIFWKVKKPRLKEVNILKVMELGCGWARRWSSADSETCILSTLFHKEVSGKTRVCWQALRDVWLPYSKEEEESCPKVLSHNWNIIFCLFFPWKFHSLIPVVFSCQKSRNIRTWRWICTFLTFGIYSLCNLNFELPFKHIKKLFDLGLSGLFS